eukprot:CAMPEP_0183745454 /NCGR_PEP_ID=MMETSP0737-20130205/66249_1 /TAXON_ID=385413 /ORGANISM="Thalassiosira miniscula, Strain CCMP1093" /LENGTH=389 /DNA_ID=CAMNT_0025981125 /DNA_START=48 /DNA_END=1218 /DNA_ORIENTATION=+
MGGDGGTISSNRTYLRGAGKACHTADHPSNALKRAKFEESERARLILGSCAVSGVVLDLSPKKKTTVSSLKIVACPYGKLYKHENALEALLHRSQTGGGGDESRLGTHIRGMKDLHPVRFHVTKQSSSSNNDGAGVGGKYVASCPITGADKVREMFLSSSSNNDGAGVGGKYVASCPITGADISSGNVPCFVIVRNKQKLKDKKSNSTKVGDDNEEDEVANNPNVLSERAIKEMGIDGLQSEYGPFDEKDMIRLAPPKTGGVFEDVRRRWEARMEEERIAKLKKKKDKKRKRGGEETDPKKPPSSTAKPTNEIQTTIQSKSQNGGGRSNNNHNSLGSSKKKSAADEARSAVRSAVAHNPVLSNLFGTDKKNKKELTEKQKRDALFTRNC